MVKYKPDTHNNTHLLKMHSLRKQRLSCGVPIARDKQIKITFRSYWEFDKRIIL